MTDLTNEDANKLFNQVSGAMRADDRDLKLSDLLSATTPDEKKEEELKEEEKVEEIPLEETPAEEQPEEKKEEEEESPPEKKADEALEEKELTPIEKELAEIKAQFESVKKENHALKSQAGRVPHIQKRLREFDQKLDELTKKSPSSQTSAKIQPKLDELLKSVKETDAVLADTIKNAILEATAGVDEATHAREVDNLRFYRDAEAATYQEVEAARLLDMHPNAKDVFQSPHWAEWKKNQSDGVRALALSSNADDVSKAFKMYAEDMLATYPQLRGTTEAPKKEEEKPTVDPAAAEKLKKIEDERARKVTTAANIGTPGAPGKQEMPSDAEALFKKFSDQIRKERTG